MAQERERQVAGDVPVELWSEIICYLEPQDILSLSHVCRALHDGIFQREVWEFIFRSFCRERALFIPSYGNIDEMDLLELIRAALGSHRWSQILAEHSNSITQQEGEEIGLKPLSSVVVPINNDHEIKTSRFLVPGGRYFIARTEESLGLFDLGQVGRKPLETPVLVARQSFSEYIRGRGLGLEITGVEGDESRLRVGLVFAGGRERADQIVIYDIVPTDPDATFTLLCSRGFKAEQSDHWALYRFHMRHNCVYLSYKHVAIVWDFIEGRYCYAPPSSPDDSTLTLATLFSGNTVAHIHHDSVSVWRVPLIDQVVDETGTVFIPQRDFVTPEFVLPLPPIPVLLDILTPSPWLQNQLGLMTFDFITRHSLPYEHVRSSRYQLQTIDWEHDIQLEFQWDFDFPANYSHFANNRMMYISDYTPGTMLALVTKGGVVHYNYVDTPSCLPARAAQTQMTPIQVEDLGDGQFAQSTQLCPASGRSLSLAKTREDGLAVRIVDYHSFRSCSCHK